MREPRLCAWCSKRYTPAREAQRFCKPKCGRLHSVAVLRNERIERRRVERAGRHPLTRRWEALEQRFGHLLYVEPMPPELQGLSVLPRTA